MVVWVISYTAQLLALVNHKYGGLNAPYYTHLKIKSIIGNANQCAEPIQNAVNIWSIHMMLMPLFSCMHELGTHTHTKIIFFIITL